MSTRTLISLLSAIACVVGIGIDLPLQGQSKSPLAGGMWERYSVKNAKGEETGGGPGWYFLAFTDDGNYFIAAAPKGQEKLPKPAKEMTKDELVKQVETVQFRRGTYAITGDGPAYTLTVLELAKTESPTLNKIVFQISMENGEARVATANGGVIRWRRVSSGQ